LVSYSKLNDKDALNDHLNFVASQKENISEKIDNELERERLLTH
jgi:hypothetical protein